MSQPRHSKCGGGGLYRQLAPGGLTPVNAGGAILVPKYITEFADAR